jgi:glycosyltransferase involved in cell wall biosynthesis
MKVALVYDRVNKWGGAERVLLALHELYPDAPLYTSVYNKKTAKWAKVFTVKTSFLQYFPFASSAHEYYPWLMPKVFESFSFDEYDLVISVSSEAAKGIITKGKTIHVCYLLTPTRYLWSGYKQYFRNSFFRILSYPIVSSLRIWDKKASKRPHVYIAISEEVKKRIKKYYNRSASVIYPPVTVQNTSRDRNKISSSGNYFLVVSRLVGYKRIELAVMACTRLGLPLKVIGIGSEEKRLRQLAGPTIEFLGLLTQDRLLQYYKGCKALLFPGIEDFGLTVLEAQACGKPVIAFRGGGALETIIENKTGVFFTPQTVNALASTLQNFDKKRFSSKASENNTKRFSKDRFKREFKKYIQIVMKEKGVNT